MELDDFKKALQETGPVMNETKNQPTNNNTMDSLIEKLKATDEKDKKALLYLIIIFCVFIGIYSGISLS
jgi:formate-dependent nitrite reductase membrane component NrfD